MDRGCLGMCVHPMTHLEAVVVMVLLGRWWAGRLGSAGVEN